MFSELYTIRKFEFRVVTFILNQTIYVKYEIVSIFSAILASFCDPTSISLTYYVYIYPN